MFELIVYKALDSYWVVCNGRNVPKDQRVPTGGEAVFTISGPDAELLFKEARKEANQRGIQVQNLDQM